MTHTRKGSLAVIPARSGSKRLPQKNVLELSGKPLIAWTIESAVSCAIFDKVIVSTDSDVIANISRSYGADIPFIRPADLSSDTSTSFDVVAHALNHYSQLGIEYETVALLQPTSPLRTAAHIKDAFTLFNEKNANSIISVCECEHSPLWSNILGNDMSLDNFVTREMLTMRSQELPQYHRLNGAIYICKTKSLIESKSFFGENGSYAYKMGADVSVDIDNLIDFQLAEVIMSNRSIK
ncbi:MAG: CMP-N-acetlyneuraminic acid synthetase [Alteromonadaceae bacterium]|uniref:acylneuraminate cytidylyltransferase family protein n=1 Tax=Paraglaciecola chathamensis TaxID=368405 RepID=UPI000C51DB15|nr:acylneuraminate cytidylyltransferase family protein [Paraglaciecola agarilytica]MBN25736.1 CMP-N-acetlyneuraminic acid synthetase [Alteromonadaceae bacterium]|tara:strand:+ start:155264 stop:155977 length:714 start_codon:yes stop_codon:yes gene_type:complete